MLKRKNIATQKPLTELRRTWQAMKQRCFNKRLRSYSDYGGRGITVCEEWKNSFDVFLSDMGVRPSKDYSIDRIDNNGNYCKENCRWATNIEQANNRRHKRSNIMFEYNGEMLSLAEIVRIYDVSFGLLYSRVKSKQYTIAECIETPSGKMERINHKKQVEQNKLKITFNRYGRSDFKNLIYL